MKELTMKFRELFALYDYRSKDIKKLTQLLDLVLSMMTIIDSDDINYIQKLSSFVKIFSSDLSVDILGQSVICLDLLDDSVIDVIYENQILPIFVYFDNKYGGNEKEKECNDSVVIYNTDSQELHEVNSGDLNKETRCDPNIKEGINTSLEDGNKTISYDEVLNNIDNENREYELNNKDDPEIINDDYSNSILFNVLKSTSNELFDIWTCVKSNTIKDEEDKIDKVERVRLINESIKITLFHPHNEIRKLSKIMYGICNLLLDIIESDIAPSQSNISTVKLLFNTIEDMKYIYCIN